MATEMERAWRRFEKRVADIQKQLTPNANVQHDDHIYGHDSEQYRQVDVSVKIKIGQYDLLIAMSCKNWAAPVDIDEVDSFSNVIEDIRANKGAMVARNGFTDGAKNMAKAKGIDLYRLIDAEAYEWQAYVSIPVLCDFRALHQYQFALPNYLVDTDYNTITLYNSRKEELGTLSELVRRQWNAGRLPSEPGEHGWFCVTEEKTYAKYKDAFCDADIRMNINVREKLYFGQLQLIDIKGFRDEHTGAIATRGFTTEFLNVKKVERQWTEMTDARDLSVRPLLTLTAIDIYDIP